MFPAAQKVYNSSLLHVHMPQDTCSSRLVNGKGAHFSRCYCACETGHVHLASHGCNMWEREFTGELHILWMHVDGSPWPSW